MAEAKVRLAAKALASKEVETRVAAAEHAASKAERDFEQRAAKAEAAAEAKVSVSDWWRGSW